MAFAFFWGRGKRLAPNAMSEPIYYHVITRGNNRVDVFNDDADRKRYLSDLGKCAEELPLSLHNYVLMTNHVHLLLSLEDPSLLPKIMKRINLNYSLFHRARYGRIDHLWRNRYRRYVIDTDKYLVTCGVYIELNPVRAGMTVSQQDYAWSSHRFYALGEANPLLVPSPAFLNLGNTDEERRKEYAKITQHWQNRAPQKNDARKFFKKKSATYFI